MEFVLFINFNRDKNLNNIGLAEEYSTHVYGSDKGLIIL